MGVDLYSYRQLNLSLFQHTQLWFFAPLLPFLFPRPVNDSEKTKVLELVLIIAANYRSTYRYACKCYQLGKSTKTLHFKYIFCMDANQLCLVNTTAKSLIV